MGLDQYLNGKVFLWSLGDEEVRHKGKRVRSLEVELGYWRKHPDLHGYIVEQFGPKEEKTGRPIDDCQPIELDEVKLKRIIDAVKTHKLPHTQGFFFGGSYKPGDPEYEAEKTEDLKILEEALRWLAEGKTKEVHQKESRSVEYCASW